MKRYKCDLCPFETDDLEEMREHLDSEHDSNATLNLYFDRAAPGLEGIPQKVYRFTPQSRDLRDKVKERAG